MLSQLRHRSSHRRHRDEGQLGLDGLLVQRLAASAGEPLPTSGLYGRVTALCAAGDVIFTGDDYGTLRLFDLLNHQRAQQRAKAAASTGTRRRRPRPIAEIVLEPHAGSVTAIVPTGLDGSSVVTAGDDGTLRWFEVEPVAGGGGGEPMKPVKIFGGDHRSSVAAACVVNGHTIVACSSDSMVRVHDSRAESWDQRPSMEFSSVVPCTTLGTLSGGAAASESTWSLFVTSDDRTRSLQLFDMRMTPRGSTSVAGVTDVAGVATGAGCRVAGKRKRPAPSMWDDPDRDGSSDRGDDAGVAAIPCWSGRIARVDDVVFGVGGGGAVGGAYGSGAGNGSKVGHGRNRTAAKTPAPHGTSVLYHAVPYRQRPDCILLSETQGSVVLWDTVRACAVWRLSNPYLSRASGRRPRVYSPTQSHLYTTISTEADGEGNADVNGDGDGNGLQVVGIPLSPRSRHGDRDGGAGAGAAMRHLQCHKHEVSALGVVHGRAAPPALASADISGARVLRSAAS